MNIAPGFKAHLIVLIALLLAWTVLFASCSGETSHNSSPPLPATTTQTSALNPNWSTGDVFDNTSTLQNRVN